MQQRDPTNAFFKTPREENEKSSYAYSSTSDYVTCKRSKMDNLNNNDILRIKKSSIFENCHIYVDGVCHLPLSTMKELILGNGGRFDTFLGPQTTTVVCNTFNWAKHEQYRKMKKPPKVVTSHWIEECVKAGKKLSESSFFLEKSNNNLNQFAQNKQENDNKPKSSPIFTNYMVSFENSNKLNNIPMKTNSNDKIIAHLESKISGNSSKINSHVKTEQNEKASPFGGRFSKQKKSHLHFGKKTEKNDKNDDINTKTTTTTPTPESKKVEIFSDSSEKSTKSRLNEKPDYTKNNFVSGYLKSSRLHFLTEVKQKIIHSLQERQQTKFSTIIDENSSKPLNSFEKYETFIAHIDMDCFFASVSVRNRPDLKEKPVCVAYGSNERLLKRNNDNKLDEEQKKFFSCAELASCNYPARKFGVKNGMWLGTAFKLCPDIIILPYDFKGIEESLFYFF